MAKKADISWDGQRQTVRLPDDIHLFETHVLIRQNEANGEITLLPESAATGKPAFEKFFAMRHSLTDEELQAFDVPRDGTPPTVRELF